MLQSPSPLRLRLTRLEGLLVGVAVVSGLAAVAIALVEKPDGPTCRPTHTRSTELPLAVGAVIVFVATAVLLVIRNRDVHNKRQPMRQQVGQVVAASILGLFYVALSQLFLENRWCD